MLSRTQAGPSRTIAQQQEQISPNHVHAIYGTSVVLENYSNLYYGYTDRFKFKYSEFVEAASSRRGGADATAAKGELLQFAAR